MDVFCFILAACSGALFLFFSETDAHCSKATAILQRAKAFFMLLLALLEILRIQELWVSKWPSMAAAAVLAALAVAFLVSARKKSRTPSCFPDAALGFMIAWGCAAIPWIGVAIFPVFGLFGLLFVRVLVRFRERAFQTDLRRKWLFPICMGMVVVSAISLFAVARQNSRDREMREDLLQHARAVANAISFNDLDKLRFTAEDASNPIYERLSRQMADFAHISGYKSIYTIARKNERFLFGPESLPPGDPLSSPPGTAYVQPPFSLYLAFLSGKPLATGPYSDEYGTFVSAFVPIIHPETGRVRLVVGMDIEAPNWRHELARARMVPLAFGFLCLLFIALTQRLLHIPSEKAARHPLLVVRHAHAFLVFALGIVFTAYAAETAHQDELETRRNAFREQAMQRAFAFQKMLLGIEQNELRALSRFHQSSKEVLPSEFASFTQYLVTRPHVYAVMYAASVDSARIPEFEREMQRLHESPDYRVYPAASTARRPLLHPVYMVEPAIARHVLLGYDLGDSPDIEDAMQYLQERSSAFSDGFSLPGEKGQDVNVVALVRPIPPRDSMERRQFAVLFLRQEQLLRNGQERISPTGRMEPEEAVFLQDLYEVRRDHSMRLVASSRDVPNPNPAEADEIRKLLPLPVFAFGKTYLFVCFEGPQFRRNYPLKTARFVVYSGSALTLVLSLLVGLILSWQRRLKRELERQSLGWKSSEQKFHQLVEKSPIAILVLTNRRIQYANLAALRLLESEDGRDILGTAFSGFVVENFQDRLDRILDSVGEQETFVEMQLSIAGRNVPCEIHFVRITVDREAGVLLFIRNLTQQIQAQLENQQLQAQLEKSRKIESVARLANGVAHDFNNMLGVILGAADMLLQQMPLDDPNRRDVLEIQAATGRAADLVRRLLQFSKRQDGTPVLLDINRKIKMELPALFAPFSKRIVSRWEPAETLWLVRMDPEQLSQALSILVKNACEAITGEGTVTVKTFNVVRAAPGTDHMGEFVVFSVSDSGPGMDEEIQARLFEPFFTTKKPEEHAGLGLALLHAIVMQNGGFVDVQSHPGKGSVFLVHLPKAYSVRMHGDSFPEKSPAPSVQLPENENVCVLYVDDEEANLRIAQRILERHGFVVHTAGSAREALQLLTSSEIRSLHVMVCDVALPDLPAKALAEMARKHFPNLRILFVSGYSYNALVDQGMLESGQEFLAKPFSGEQLVRAIGELVGQRPPVPDVIQPQ